MREGMWKEMGKEVQKEVQERKQDLVDGYIGTYASENSKGVYHFFFDPDTGRMTEPR